jgi:hypothetical protein
MDVSASGMALKKHVTIVNKKPGTNRVFYLYSTKLCQIIITSAQSADLFFQVLIQPLVEYPVPQEAVLRF